MVKKMFIQETIILPDIILTFIIWCKMLRIYITPTPDVCFLPVSEISLGSICDVFQRNYVWGSTQLGPYFGKNKER
jgi:hypothetical protein